MLFQNSNSFFARCASLIVFTRGMLMLDHGIADHDPRFRRHWQQLEFEGPAVQQQRVIAFSLARDELVHDPAAHSDELVLSTLTEKRQLRSIQRLSL